MPQELDRGVIRICNQEGETVGTGFVVSEHLAVTCAHVVNAAVKKNPECGREPDEVLIRYYLDNSEQIAKKLAFGNDLDDVAFLQLKTLPEGVIPLQLAPSANLEHHIYDSLGFPLHSEPASERRLSGVIDGPVGASEIGRRKLLELTGETAYFGMSGAPILDRLSRRVVGMITASKNLEHTKLVYATTSETILLYLREDLMTDENTRREAEKNFVDLRNFLKKGDLERAATKLEGLKRPSYHWLISQDDLEHAEKLILSREKTAQDIQTLFPDREAPDSESWADETAGALIALLRRKNDPFSIADKIMLLRDYPKHLCGPVLKQKLFEMRKEIGMPGPATPRNWPVRSPKARPARDLVLKGNKFCNPFYSQKGEVEKKYLFPHRGGLFFPDHTLYKRHKAMRNQPLECIYGEHGIGRTTLGMALSEFHYDHTVLGVFVQGLQDIESITQDFSRVLIDFVCANPDYLSKLDLKNHQILADLCVEKMGDAPIRARLARLLNNSSRPMDMAGNIMAPLTKEDCDQIESFEQAVSRVATSQASNSHWLFAFYEVAFNLGFSRTSLVIDAQEDFPVDWVEKNLNPYRQVLARVGVQTTLLLPISNRQRQNPLRLVEVLERQDIPCSQLYWEFSGDSSLDVMLDYRWKTYNKGWSIRDCVQDYDKLLERAENNPGRFIASWIDAFQHGGD